MEGDGLTAEQRARIERNRLEAIERLKQRRAITTIVKPQAASQPLPTTTITGKKKLNWRMIVQLDSPTTFCTAAYGPLYLTFKDVPGARFIQKEHIWLERLGINKPAVDDQIPQNVLSLFNGVEFPQRTFNLSGIEFCESLYQFQREGVEMALSRNGRVMLADDMGLGKSIQALAIAVFYRLEWPLLIVTPASMVASWHEQVKRWIPSVSVDTIRVVYDGKGGLDGLVNILSYDLAVKLLPATACRFGVIIADESHALKNSDSKRSKVLVPFLKQAGRAILLSGTPALSRPLELYPQIQAVQPKLFPRFFDFGKRYCNGHRGTFGWDFKGSSNLRELQLVLERTVLIRRMKDDVLSQLPRKLRHQKLLDLRKAPQNIDDEPLEEFQKKTEYMALWKHTAEIKLPAMLEYMDDLLDADHKMLIFVHHQSVLDAFEGHLLVKKTRFIRIDGKTATSSRQDLCTAFQTDSTIRVAILSITAASTGLTLTAATTVIFAELFWNPGVLLQAEDRAHRIGQCDAVNVHYLLAKGTSDDLIWPLITKKLEMLEEVGLCKNDFSKMQKQQHDPSQLRLDKFVRKRPHDSDSATNEPHDGDSATSEPQSL